VLSRPQLNTTVCTVTGTLHTGTTPVLSEALVEAQRDDNAHLVIDLATIISMDANAVSLYTLLHARYTHDISGNGLIAAVVVVDPNSQAISALHLATLEATFDMHHNLTDALHACTVADSVDTADKGGQRSTADAELGDRRRYRGDNQRRRGAAREAPGGIEGKPLAPQARSAEERKRCGLPRLGSEGTLTAPSDSNDLDSTCSTATWSIAVRQVTDSAGPSRPTGGQRVAGSQILSSRLVRGGVDDLDTPSDSQSIQLGSQTPGSGAA
jgi:hypothetical protein